MFEDDEVGRRFADLLLQKQAEGVQVNLIYDSVGCMTTPSAFFQRLRDGGIQVREFNPINPSKMRGNNMEVKPTRPSEDFDRRREGCIYRGCQH